MRLEVLRANVRWMGLLRALARGCRVGLALKALALEPEASQAGLRCLGDSVGGGLRIDRDGDADEPATAPQVGGRRDQWPRPLVARAPVLVKGRDPAAVDLPGRRVHGGEPA